MSEGENLVRTITLFCTSMALFGFSLIGAQGQVHDGILVGEIVEQIEKNDAISVVGFEFNNGSRDKIADATTVLTAIRQLDFTKLGKMIAGETDYECLTGKGYVIMIPKDDPSKHDTPLAKRLVFFPNATNMPVYDFLSQVKGFDKEGYSNNTAYLRGSLSLRPDVSGPISIEGGHGPCYQLLNALTIKLKARSWCIEHGTWPDINAKPGMPLQFGLGNVDIYARPSMGWIDTRH